MARPKKYDIDEKQVVKLASYGCTNREVANFFGCSENAPEKCSENALKIFLGPFLGQRRKNSFPMSRTTQKNS